MPWKKKGGSSLTILCTSVPEGFRFIIDLGAEKFIAAEKDHEKIVVEIKSFSGSSVITDFHEALGQYRNYLIALKGIHH